jgi:hypothetical protein
LVTVVETFEVASLQLVIKPSSSIRYVGCAGSDLVGCTPRLTAAQHMQADVVREALTGQVRLADWARIEVHVRGWGGVPALEAIRGRADVELHGPPSTRATGGTRLSPVKLLTVSKCLSNHKY